MFGPAVVPKHSLALVHIITIAITAVNIPRLVTRMIIFTNGFNGALHDASTIQKDAAQIASTSSFIITVLQFSIQKKALHNYRCGMYVTTRNVGTMTPHDSIRFGMSPHSITYTSTADSNFVHDLFDDLCPN